ncbi:MAG: hypothetical protein PVH12_02380 [Candidatus Bathyarchaeota archaeon]
MSIEEEPDGSITFFTAYKETYFWYIMGAGLYVLGITVMIILFYAMPYGWIPIWSYIMAAPVLETYAMYMHYRRFMKTIN